MGRSGGGGGTSVGMFRAPPGIVGNPASTATFNRRSVRQRSMSRDRLTYDRDNDSLNHDDEDEEEEEDDEELTEEEEEQWATSTADNWTDYDQVRRGLYCAYRY